MYNFSGVARPRMVCVRVCVGGGGGMIIMLNHSLLLMYQHAKFLRTLKKPQPSEVHASHLRYYYNIMSEMLTYIGTNKNF